MLQILNDFSGVVVGDLGRPPSANSFGPVDQDHGEDGDVEVGLDLHVVVLEIVQNVVIVWGEAGLVTNSSLSVRSVWTVYASHLHKKNCVQTGKNLGLFRKFLELSQNSYTKIAKLELLNVVLLSNTYLE